jgi:hypothetical protein
MKIPRRHYLGALFGAFLIVSLAPARPAAAGSATLAVGTVITALSNASANPVAGTFADLADAAILTVGANNFQTSYEGGDGNDLTLTVVP